MQSEEVVGKGVGGEIGVRLGGGIMVDCFGGVELGQHVGGRATIV